MRRILIVLGILALAGVGAFYWWLTSPLFALQEAATAIKDRDFEKFQERVDINFFIESLLDDLLVYPAKTTFGLTRFQREVSAGAVALAKAQLQQEFTKAIEKTIGNGTSRPMGMLPGETPAYAGELIASNEFSDVLKETGRQMSGSVNRLKQVAYERMLNYAKAHREMTPGRLLACDPSQRSAELKQMLAEDGLTLENFRGPASYKVADDANGRPTCILGLKFFSAKVSKEVILQLELAKNNGGAWQVKRLANVTQYFKQLGEDYDDEMHSMIASSLSGMTDAAVNSELKGATENIRNSKAAQSLFNRLHINIK